MAYFQSTVHMLILKETYSELTELTSMNRKQKRVSGFINSWQYCIGFNFGNGLEENEEINKEKNKSCFVKWWFHAHG